MPAQRTDRPFSEEVPRLLAERGWSIRRLAIAAGVDRGYLWKVIRRRNYKTPSARLTAAVATAFELPRDYFPEYRERVVIGRVQQDGTVRDEFYDLLSPERLEPRASRRRRDLDRDRHEQE